MSKILRKNMKIFGQNAGFQQLGVIGSLAAGSAAYSTDPETIQSLSNYIDGWFDVVLGNNSPAIQDMNSLCYLFAYQLAYLMQEGIAEWNSLTTYYIGSVAQDGTGVSYVSLVDTNLNHALSDTTKWKKLPSNVMTAVGDIIFGDTPNGNASRLAIGNTNDFLTPVSSKPVWKPLPTSQYWNGYHEGSNSFVSWQVGSTSAADYTNPGSDSSIDLVQVNNSGFGTVSPKGGTGTSALPGIIFTPPAVGVYLVSVSVMLTMSALGQFVGVRVWDGTTIISAIGALYGQTAVNASSVTLTGVYVVSSIASPITLSLQGSCDNGGQNAIQPSPINGPASTSRSIEWNIVRIA